MNETAPEKWIYGFRRASSREITPEERNVLRAKCRQCRLIAASRFLLVLILAATMFVALAVAAGGMWFGWPLLLLATAALIWSLITLSAPEKQRLLYRRALRLAAFTRYEYEGFSDRINGAYERFYVLRGGEDPEGEDAFLDTQGIWSEEEKLIERTGKLLGRPPPVDRNDRRRLRSNHRRRQDRSFRDGMPQRRDRNAKASLAATCLAPEVQKPPDSSEGLQSAPASQAPARTDDPAYR